MKTISHHRPSGSPKGDTKARCDICGVHWHRSRLRRDTAGRLVCPQEGPGADELQLNRRVAAAASRPRMKPSPGLASNTGPHNDHTLLKIFGDDLILLLDMDVKSSQGSAVDLTGNGWDAAAGAQGAATYSASAGPDGHGAVTIDAGDVKYMEVTGLPIAEGDRTCMIVIANFVSGNSDDNAACLVQADDDTKTVLRIHNDRTSDQWEGEASLESLTSGSTPTISSQDDAWHLGELYLYSTGVEFFTDGYRDAQQSASGLPVGEALGSNADGSLSLRFPWKNPDGSAQSTGTSVSLVALLSRPPPPPKRRMLRDWVAIEYPSIDLTGRHGA